MIKENSNKIISKKLTSFDFFGPTCDSMDYMKGPFLLPNNIKENDYIELGQLGAYGLTFSCLLYTSPSPRDPNRSRMPSSA